MRTETSRQSNRRLDNIRSRSERPSRVLAASDPGAELRAAHVAYYAARRHPDGLPLWWSDILGEWKTIPADLVERVMAA